MILTLLKDNIGTVVLSVALVVSAGCFYKIGQLTERADNVAEAARVKDDLDSKIRQLEGDIKKKEGIHLSETKRLTDELIGSNQKHDEAIATLNAGFAERLRNSEARANVYKRQAGGSSAERDNLAEHAARLDQSLEEGRRLVRELRETIGKRDAAIRALGSMILTDRNLFSESSKSNGTEPSTKK